MKLKLAEPDVFSTSRFTFPYSVVGRPFPLSTFAITSPLGHRTRVGLNHRLTIRQEFFGSIVFGQYARVTKGCTPYGHLTYFNQSGSRILAALGNGITVGELASVARQGGCSPEELETFLQKCIQLGVVNTEVPLGKAPTWDEQQWSSTEKHLSAPLRLYLNITERCNLRCKFCYASAGGKRRQLGRDVLEAVLDEAHDMKIPTLVMIGGEPFLYPDFTDILECALDRGLSVFVSTNGLLLDRLCVERLQMAKLPIVAVSLDAASAKEHDAVRALGTFDRTVLGITNAIKEGLNVSLSTTLTGQTIHRARELLDFGIDLGVCDFHFMAIAPAGRGKDSVHLVPSKQDILDLRDTLRHYTRACSGITVNCTSVVDPDILQDWHQNFSGNEAAEYVYTSCEAGRFRLEVGFGGHFVPCVLLDNGSFHLGLAGRDRLSNVWHDSEILRGLRARLPERTDEQCRSCHAVQVCRGGCRGVIYSAFGSLDHQDPTCFRRQGIIQ